MPRQILVRDIPEDTYDWIERERHHRHQTQREFINEILARTREEAEDDRQLDFLHEAGRWLGARRPRLAFKFIDIFAGIGGFRIGLERAGGRCVFTSEWDRFAQKTYQTWFGETPHGDIREVDPVSIPDHDLLAAGFPCQPFSIAGVSKKKSLGREHGFLDRTQGTLFFHLAKIMEVKRPPAAILENVKNLCSHDKGRTWQVIRTTLDELEYVVFDTIIDARHWVPQHRERVYIVCFDRRVFGDLPPFEFPAEPSGIEPRLGEILTPDPDPRYVLSDKLWQYLRDYAAKHKMKGNGFGYGIADPGGTTRTLSARYYKDGSEILIARDDANPRRLTPREAARLMGFPDELPIVVSDTQAYRQFGNAVVPAVIERIAEEVGEVFRWQIDREGNGCLVKRGRADGGTSG